MAHDFYAALRFLEYSCLCMCLGIALGATLSILLIYFGIADSFIVSDTWPDRFEIVAFPIIVAFGMKAVFRPAKAGIP